MKYSELIDGVAAKLNISKANAKTTVEAVFGTVSEALAKGDAVAVKDFGNFQVKNRPARTTRNPQTGETVEVAAKNAVKFKASTTLGSAVNG